MGKGKVWGGCAGSVFGEGRLHECKHISSLLALVSCPDPTLSRGKGSGDHRALSWLCRVSSIDSEQANEIAQRHKVSKIKIADSAQPRSAQ